MRIPEGTIVAMLTPFDKEGKINEAEVRKLVNFLIGKGVDGIFPVSSCGEYTHMDMSERKFLIDVVVDENRGRVDIIPGTGATCYHQSIELAKYAKQKNCSAIVLHGPYFFKNTEEVVEGHLRKVAVSVDIPVFVYNIPFFANEVTPLMVERLSNIPNVVGIKDSSGNMVNVMNLLEMTRKVNPDFKVLVGAEEIYLPALLMGGKGCMTATAGIVPEFMIGIYKAFKEGNINLAYNLQFAMLPLIRDMKSVNFPQGFKEALSVRGIEMGPPKMNYPPEAMAKIADLRERLRLEMGSLIQSYFPQSQLRYSSTSINPKYIYPEPGYSTQKIKKYSDCTMCGMCEGSKFERSVNNISGNGNGYELKNYALNEKSPSLSIDISDSQLSSIISEVIKKLNIFKKDS
ncbi:MAG: dihydrodipicolinate synthase family protein [Actinobacteria bacterium]|nr:dihydrodipicolinate synthase family protein [Actinomycetota bacterium]